MATKKYQPHITVREKVGDIPAKVLRILTEDDLPFDVEVDEDVYALLNTVNTEVL